MRQRRLHICVLLDVSESTSAIKSRVVCSLRLFLQERLARHEQTKRLELYVFSDRCEKILSDVELETLDFERFDEAFDSVLACKGVTTLCDSLCVTIDAFGAKLAALDEDLRPEEVVFVVVTDGLDNASQLYSIEDVKSRISLQSSAYHWNFVFFNAQLYQFCSDSPLDETPCDGLFDSQKKAEILALLIKENEETTEVENSDESVGKFDVEFSAVPDDVSEVVEPVPAVEFSAVPEEIEEVSESIESAESSPEVEFFAVPEETEETSESVESAESIPEVEFFAAPEEVEETSAPVESAEPIPDVEFFAAPEEVEETSEPVESAEPIPEVEFFAAPEEVEETSAPVESAESIPEVEFFAAPEEAEETSESVESAEPIPEVEFFAAPEEAEETSEPVESAEPIPEVEFVAVPEDDEDDSELEFSAPSETESEPLNDSEASDDEAILEDSSLDLAASQAPETTGSVDTESSDTFDVTFDEAPSEQSATLDGENDDLTSDVAPPSDVWEESFDVVHFENIGVDTREEQKSSSFDDACEWEEYDVEDIKEPTIILPSSSFFTVKSLDPKLRVREDVVIDVESRDPAKDPPLSTAETRFETEYERKE